MVQACFTSCKVQFGGAVYIYSIAENSPVTIENCNFYFNEVSNEKADQNSQFYSGSVLYLTVKKGSIDNCKFKSKGTANMIKATDNFNSPPENLKILEKIEIPSSVVITKCNFESDNDPTSFYVIEKQILSSEIDGNVLSENASSNLFYVRQKSNQLTEKFMKPSYNNIIKVEFNNNSKKETKIVLNLSSKILISLSSVGLIALIATVIMKKKVQTQNEIECGENNSPIDSLKE